MFKLFNFLDLWIVDDVHVDNMDHGLRVGSSCFEIFQHLGNSELNCMTTWQIILMGGSG